MNKNEFITAVNELNIPINPDILKKLDNYYHLLYNENKKYNLTAITNEIDVYLKHFYDSLTIVKSYNLTNQYLLDIGTGAGFPGIVLKIFFPELKIDLLEATTKKCQFLNLVINTLNLENIQVINTRAEEYAKKNREKYDLVTSRAVAPLKHLLEYSIPTLKVGGTFIALKANLNNETQNISHYHQKLNLANEQIIEFYLPIENSHRSIYKIQKTAPTPTIYPRTYSQIKNKEL